MSDPSDTRLETLRASYQRICHESDRLRDARGYFSRPLGPAPASAGISTALVTTLGGNLDLAFLVPALAGLILLVVVGLAYDGKPAYRHLYAKKAPPDPTNPLDVAIGQSIDVQAVPVASYWYAKMIERERDIIGVSKSGNERRWPWDDVETLQQGLDSERTGLRTVQALWTTVIILLVLAVIA